MCVSVCLLHIKRKSLSMIRLFSVVLFAIVPFLHQSVCAHAIFHYFWLALPTPSPNSFIDNSNFVHPIAPFSSPFFTSMLKFQRNETSSAEHFIFENIFFYFAIFVQHSSKCSRTKNTLDTLQISFS